MRHDAVADDLRRRLSAKPPLHRRCLIALAGPPASGKSTLSADLVRALPDACVVPMDGFHLDNRVLETRGLTTRKGAPDTFDVEGFRHLLERLRQEDEVFYPVFDRTLDHAIAAAGQVKHSTKTVIVEGNYLLLDAPGWRALRDFWDVAIYLRVPENVLRERLMQRWRDHGFSQADARQKVETNDLPNALKTDTFLLSPDIILDDGEV